MRTVHIVLFAALAACSSARDKAAAERCELEVACNPDTWSSHQQCEANVLRGYDDLDAEGGGCTELYHSFVVCMAALESCEDLEDRAGSDDDYPCGAEEAAVFSCRL